MTYASAWAVMIVAIVLVIINIILVWRTNKPNEPTAIIERTGVFVLSRFRSEINQYAKEIHEHSHDQGVDPDIAEAQETTCYEIIKELNRAICEAYEVDMDDTINYWNGMTVKELLFALSDSVLSDKIKIMSTGFIRNIDRDEEGNVLLYGKQEDNGEEV